MTKDPNAPLRTLLFGTEDHPVSITRLAGKMKKSRRTLYNWRDNPSLIQIGELRKMARILGIDWEDIGRAIGGQR